MKYYIVLISILLMGCGNKMIEFNPIEKKGDAFLEQKIEADSNFVKNLEQVFGYYNVPYSKEEDNRIMIDASIYGDKDLMYNYTQKARDVEWLSTHKVE